jgi:hypothetical protein
MGSSAGDDRTLLCTAKIASIGAAVPVYFFWPARILLLTHWGDI